MTGLSDFGDQTTISYLVKDRHRQCLAMKNIYDRFKNLNSTVIEAPSSDTILPLH